MKGNYQKPAIRVRRIESEAILAASDVSVGVSDGVMFRYICTQSLLLLFSATAMSKELHDLDSVLKLLDSAIDSSKQYESVRL